VIRYIKNEIKKEKGYSRKYVLYIYIYILKSFFELDNSR